MSQLELLNRHSYMSLATVCADGSPWNTPITFVYSDGAIYWRSSDKVIHSQNIARDNRVSIAIYDHEKPSETIDREAAYIQSTAEQVEGEEKEVLLSQIGDQLSIKDAQVPLYRAKIGEANPDKSSDSRFYSNANGVNV